VHAEMGNGLVIRGRVPDAPVRAGQIREVTGPDGAPPYVVRWTDDGRTSVVFPGADAVVVEQRPTLVRR
jgi:hypothetical protein